jgi:hypothetical protein
MYAAWYSRYCWPAFPFPADGSTLEMACPRGTARRTPIRHLSRRLIYERRDTRRTSITARMTIAPQIKSPIVYHPPAVRRRAQPPPGMLQRQHGRQGRLVRIVGVETGAVAWGRDELISSIEAFERRESFIDNNNDRSSCIDIVIWWMSH